MIDTEYMPEAGSMPGQAEYGEFVEVDGLSIHVWRAGPDPGGALPLVLVHGYCAANWSWRHTMAGLSGRRIVAAPDLPGFGLSDKPREFDYTLSGYARFIASFMDKMEMREAILVGNSMGGGVAVKTALLFPERVRGLVLIDSLGYFKRGFHVYRFFGWPVVRDLIMAAAGPSSVRLLMKARVYHDTSGIDDELIRRFTAAYRTENGRKAPIWVYRGLAPYPVIPAEQIARIASPTLVIWGAHDRILPVAHAGRFSRDLPGAETVIIPDAGHVPHEERPEAVNRLIADFIDRRIDRDGAPARTAGRAPF